MQLTFRLTGRALLLDWLDSSDLLLSFTTSKAPSSLKQKTIYSSSEKRVQLELSLPFSTEAVFFETVGLRFSCLSLSHLFRRDSLLLLFLSLVSSFVSKTMFPIGSWGDEDRWVSGSSSAIEQIKENWQCNELLWSSRFQIPTNKQLFYTNFIWWDYFNTCYRKTW